MRRIVSLAVWVSILSAGVLNGFGAEDASSAEEERTVILVVGLPGTEDYAAAFNAWADNWRRACELAHAKCLTVGLPATAEPEGDETTPAHLESPGPETDYGRLKQLLEDEPKESSNELWIVFVGHGTFNGREAKFNLRGPDLTEKETAEWLKPFRRPTLVINTASASAPFLSALAHPNRLVVAATRSGFEQNYARFGKFMSEAIADTTADLDKDGQTSLLEGFIFASKQTQEFYKTEARLATEHALLDDNGDGHGTPADWFRGVRATKKPTQGNSVDGFRAHQFHLVRSEAEQKLTPEVRAQRDELERSIFALREKKAEMDEDDYYATLEKILLELAAIYEKGDDNPPAN